MTTEKYVTFKRENKQTKTNFTVFHDYQLEALIHNVTTHQLHSALLIKYYKKGTLSKS